MRRCSWASNDLNIPYHDAEWGVPVHDDHLLFEFLILEGAQAGLSWDTILKKREAYRDAFVGFDPVKVARFSDSKLERLMTNEGIIRNRLKIASAVSNAKAFMKVQKELGHQIQAITGDVTAELNKTLEKTGLPTDKLKDLTGGKDPGKAVDDGLKNLLGGKKKDAEKKQK